MANARRQELRSSVQEIIGLSLLVFGVLLFLALISYTPRDVPSWFPGSFTDHPNRNTQNFVGSFGAIMACTSYLTLGAASYLLAVALIGYGAMTLLGKMMGFSLRPIWTAGFVVSGACLVHVLGWSLIDRGSMKVSSEGGIIGEMLGGKVFYGIFGPASIVVLLLIPVPRRQMVDMPADTGLSISPGIAPRAEAAAGVPIGAVTARGTDSVFKAATAVSTWDRFSATRSSCKPASR